MPDYKVLTIPFARDAVPDMVNDIPDAPSVPEPQLASWQQGFPYITTIPLVAGGIPPEGQDFNGILRDITEHVVHQNKGGMYKFEAEVVAAGGYPEGAVLAANDGLSLWVSLVDANVEDFNTGTPTQWARIAFSGLDALLNGKVDKTSIVQGTGASTTNIMSQKAVTDALAGVDKINGPIATVAAAGTIDLTAGAPDTSQLVISGTGVNINGFTVAANRFFVVKMTGSTNTLVNSASLVTGRGANIPVVAGDCFLMRSTATNTVEIVGGSFLIDRGIGSGQTVKDVTASRSIGTLFTNTDGKTRFVSIHTSNAGSGGATLTVNGVVFSKSTIVTGADGTMCAPVPNLGTYRVDNISAYPTDTLWLEINV